MNIDYYAYQSKLKNLNSGFKVFFSVTTIILVIALNKISSAVFVTLSMGALTTLVGKTPLRLYSRLMSIPITFIILSGLAIAIQLGSEPIGEYCISLHYFYLFITKDSLTTAVKVFFKAMAGVSSLYMLSLSTPITEIVAVLQKLHLPDILAELMNLIYRYIFILLDVAERMQTATRARLGYRNFFTACNSFAGIASNLFIISLKKSGEYYDALVARGYNGKLEFLTEQRSVKLWQILGCTAYLTLIVIIAIKF